MTFAEISRPDGIGSNESRILIPDHLLNPEALSSPNPFNIIIDDDFADPDILYHNGILTAIGTHTDGVNPDQTHMPDYLKFYTSSGDLTQWQPGGNIISKPAVWKNNMYEWAGHRIYNDYTGLYILYSSGSMDGRTMGLGIAESMYPVSDFQDNTPAPLIGGIPEVKDRTYNWHIDASTYVNEYGDRMLVYGSAGIPLFERQLTKRGDAFASGSKRRVLLRPEGRMYEERIEAGIVKYMFGEKWLLYSGDDCFGNGKERFGITEGSRYGDYAVMAARFNPRTGFFERKTDLDPTATTNAILEGNEDFKNPGHNDVLTINQNGEEMYFMVTSVIDRSNQYHPDSKKNRRPIVISRILLKDGWLYIPGGNFSVQQREYAGQFW